jgi:hypothetical protein
MPKISWEEISEIKHGLANDIQSLYGIELSLRDFHRTHSTDIVFSAVDKIVELRRRLSGRHDSLMAWVEKHE